MVGSAVLIGFLFYFLSQAGWSAVLWLQMWNNAYSQQVGGEADFHLIWGYIWLYSLHNTDQEQLYT